MDGSSNRVEASTDLEAYATICQWIVDAWAAISVTTVFRAFRKAGIITELPDNSSDTDSDNDEMEPGILDAVLAQLFNSDTEEEEFEGYVDGKLTEKVSFNMHCTLTFE